jgi:hypothetical protein
MQELMQLPGLALALGLMVDLQVQERVQLLVQGLAFTKCSHVNTTTFYQHLLHKAS